MMARSTSSAHSSGVVATTGAKQRFHEDRRALDDLGLRKHHAVRLELTYGIVRSIQLQEDRGDGEVGLERRVQRATPPLLRVAQRVAPAAGRPPEAFARHC